MTGSLHAGHSKNPRVVRSIRRVDAFGCWCVIRSISPRGLTPLSAFGGFAALHDDFRDELCQGLQLADSLTLDGHKWLNVPYDCAVFYTKDVKTLEAVCGPGSNVPAYLTTAPSSADEYIPSPMNVGIENSQRFRALPLYASLLCYGQEGYRKIVRENITFARRVEAWLVDHKQWYDVLTPLSTSSSKQGNYRISNIVLFAPSRTCGVTAFEGKDAGVQLVKAINATGKMYVTGTSWKGRSAVRLAVSNYLTDDRDFTIVTEVLSSIMSEHQ